MTDLELLKAARAKLDDDNYWKENASDLVTFMGFGDIAYTPEATDETMRQLFRKRLDDGIADEEMLQQKLAIVPMLADQP